MKTKFLLVLLAFVPIAIHAQIAHWLIPPAYDNIRLVNGIEIIKGDSAEYTVLWTKEGKRLTPSADLVHPFREGMALTTKHESAEVSGFYNKKGEFVALENMNVAHRFPFFKEGRLLLNKDGVFFFINESGESIGQFHNAYPFSNGLASCMNYEQFEKKKDPYYFFIDPVGGAVGLKLNGKDVSADDIRFLSSLSEDGKGFVVVKNRLYSFFKDNMDLQPVYADESNPDPKKQVRMDGDPIYWLVQTDSTITLRGFSGKTDTMRITLDQFAVPLNIKVNGVLKQKFSQTVESQPTYIAEMNDFTDSFGKKGLNLRSKLLFPPQFDDVSTCVGDMALVKLNGKWGVITLDRQNNFRIQMNENRPIGFRHANIKVDLRLDMPTYLSWKDTNLEADSETGLFIDGTSKTGNDTQAGNFVKYISTLDIPDSISDDKMPMEYSVRVKYEGLVTPDITIPVQAWYVKYYTLNVDDSQSTVSHGVAVLTVDIGVDRSPGDDDYHFDVRLETGNDSISVEQEKISETRYKCRVNNLIEGTSTVYFIIEEDGCPPSVFPLDITYEKPAPSLKKQSDSKEAVRVKVKDRSTRKRTTPPVPVKKRQVFPV